MDYIDRSVVVKKVMETKWESGSDGAVAMEIVAATPACGWEWDEPESVSPYCPHCGAKMGEGEIDD